MSEVGIVMKEQDRLIQLEIERTERCKGCHACIPINGKNTMTLFAINDCKASVGDQVEVIIKESGLVSATLWLYGLPLVVFLASILIFASFCPEIITLLISFSLLALSYLAVHFISKRLNRDRYMPRAIRVVRHS